MKIVRQDAIFSQDKKYRYLLIREFEKGSKKVCFIMLNPSIADEKQNDPTIRRIISFARRFDAKILWVVNLFGYISSDPDILKRVDDPIGRENDKFIKKYSDLADIVIIGWGSKGGFMRRDKEVLKIISKDKVFALKLLKHGEPAHPLYLRKDSPLIRYFNEKNNAEDS